MLLNPSTTAETYFSDLRRILRFATDTGLGGLDRGTFNLRDTLNTGSYFF